MLLNGGRNRNTLSIRVPADFEDDRELVWTSRIRGETNRAHASLAPDYFIDNIVMMSEDGSISAGFTACITNALDVTVVVTPLTL